MIWVTGEDEAERWVSRRSRETRPAAGRVRRPKVQSGRAPDRIVEWRAPGRRL